MGQNFNRFHGLKHPRDMGQVDIEAFLTFMTTQRKVSVSTHRQALSALLFLYQKVLGLGIGTGHLIHRPAQQNGPQTSRL